MLTRRSIIFIIIGIIAGLALGVVFTSLFFSIDSKSKVKTNLELNINDSNSEAIISNHLNDHAIKITYPQRDMTGNCVLSGTIYDENGNPLDGAIVRLRLLDEPWISALLPNEQITNKNGAFSFGNLTKKAKYQLFSYAQSYAVTSHENAICGSKTDIFMDKGSSLLLRFVNEHGNPLAGAKVNLAGSSLWPTRLAYANNKGLLHIKGLTSGFYTFRATYKNLSFTMLEPIALEEGDNIELEAQLIVSSQTTVIVIDKDTKKPIKNATVSFKPKNAPLLVQSKKTDKNGQVAIMGLSVAENIASVEAAGYSLSPPIEIAQGDKVTIPLKTGGTVKGIIQTVDGAPIAGAIAYAEIALENNSADVLGVIERSFLGQKKQIEQSGWPPVVATLGNIIIPGPAHIPLPKINFDSINNLNDSVNNLNDSTTNANGMFTLNNLSQGRYVIGASHKQYVTRDTIATTVKSGEDTTGVVVIMTKSTAIFVRTVNNAGYPLKDASVTIYNNDSSFLSSATTETDGFAKLAGLSGQFKILASKNGFVPTAVKLDNFRNKSAETIITLLPATQTLRGRVVDKNGFGVPDITITARSITKGQVHIIVATTQNDGTFVIESSGTGPYHVTAKINDKIQAQVGNADHTKEIKMVITDNIVKVTEPAQNGPSQESNFFAEESNNYQPAGPVQLTVTNSSYGLGGLPITIKRKNQKLYITKVLPGSAVSAAGLKDGSLLVKIDGVKIKNLSAARQAIKGKTGSIIMLEVIQNGETMNVVVQRVNIW